MRKINKNLIIVNLFFSIISLYLILTNKTDCSILKWSIFKIAILMPIVLRKMKISINNVVETLYLILIFLSFILGREFDLYDKIFWYDTLVHAVSGILTFIYGQIILKKFKNKNLELSIIFGIMMTISLSTMWEFIEYLIDQIFKTTMQEVKTNGINDTMKDISVAIITSMLTSVIYQYKEKRHTLKEKNNKSIDFIKIYMV